ncbi:cell wall hydrolase [Alkalicoccus chagannorensis]|uniref:cell wall hydrolase n=1 Tax=Alkalicoccus chagannorensis TaxID=427072 RepID=UPI000686C4CE|nr:stalk domain-containing protein [Alkalicoccus chagannorensis]
MMKKLCLTAAAAAAAVMTFGAASAAADTPDIFINQEQVSMDQPVKSSNNRTLVPVRFISEQLGAEVNWDGGSQKVTINTVEGDEIAMTIDEPSISLNGNDYDLDVIPELDNERTYLPLRHAAELMHTEVHWADGDITLTSVNRYEAAEGDSVESIASGLGVDADDFARLNQLDGSVSPGQMLRTVIPTAVSNSLSYEPETASAEESEPQAQQEPALNESEVDLLARLIHQEARGQPYQGKVAVGNVVMNRVDSNRFPGTVSGVVNQSGQFTPAMNGTINRAASQRSIEAAREALQGASPAGSALFFHNPRVTNTSYFRNMSQVTVIGDHRFAR